MIAVWFALTADVRIGKNVAGKPAGTFTDAGTTTEAELELSVTVASPVGASPERTISPVAEVLDMTCDGIRVRLWTVGAAAQDAALVTCTVSPD